MQTSNNTWTWAAQDLSDEVEQIEKFCVRFTNKEEFDRFGLLFNEACDNNAKILAARKGESADKKEEKAEEKGEKGEKGEKV